MIIKRILVCVLPWAFIAPFALAKGLGGLTPEQAVEKESGVTDPKAKAAGDTGEAAKAAGGEGRKKEEANQAKPMAVGGASNEAEGTPTRSLLIGTSFGWAGASKDSNSWRASGMADITVAYRLPMKLIGEAVYGTFRYAPMDVAPVIPKNDVNFEYVGAIQGFHFGGNTVFRVKDRLRASASAEVGYLLVALEDQLQLKTLEIPDESGVNVTVGGGADWEFLPGVDLGARLYLGFGSISTTQFTVSSNFSL